MPISPSSPSVQSPTSFPAAGKKPMNTDLSSLPPFLRDLAEHSFLKGLSRPHLEILADCAMLAHFDADQVIFREGEPANRFYLLRRGRISVGTNTERGRLVVQEIGAGDVLGWSWLYPPYYWHFDARALEPTEAMFFYGTRLRQLCEDDPSLGYALMKRTAAVVIDRLVAAQKQLASSPR